MNKKQNHTYNALYCKEKDLLVLESIVIDKKRYQRYIVAGCIKTL